MDFRIDDATLGAAECMLLAQKFVPTSPAEFDGAGDICLCAAGILARAGLSCRFSDAEADRFSRECVTHRTKGPLFTAFNRLGWPSQLCAEMIKANDEAKSETRARIVCHQLEALRK